VFEKFRHKDIVPYFRANLQYLFVIEDPPQDDVFYGRIGKKQYLVVRSSDEYNIRLWLSLHVNS